MATLANDKEATMAILANDKETITLASDEEATFGDITWK